MMQLHLIMIIKSLSFYTALAPPTSMSIQPPLLGSESTANDFIASRMGLYPAHRGYRSLRSKVRVQKSTLTCAPADVAIKVILHLLFSRFWVLLQKAERKVLRRREGGRGVREEGRGGSEGRGKRREKGKEGENSYLYMLMTNPGVQ